MKRGYLYIAVTTLLFSSMEVALKLISGQFNPIQLNFSRFVVGGLVLIPFAVRELKKRSLKLDGKALGSFAMLGLMLTPGFVDAAPMQSALARVAQGADYPSELTRLPAEFWTQHRLGENA